MPASRTCPNCRTANEADAAFCESCGQPLGAAPAAPPMAPQPVAAAPAKKMSAKTIGLVAAGVLVAAYLFVPSVKATVTSAVSGLTGAKAAQADSSKSQNPDLSLPPATTDLSKLNDAPADTHSTPAPVVRDTAAQLAQPIEAPRQLPRPATRVGSRPPAGATQAEVSRPQPVGGTVSAPIPTPPAPTPQGSSTPAPVSQPVSQPPASNPAPVAPPPAPRVGAGATLALRSSDQVCTDNTREGARFKATLDQEVTGANGGRIPRGATVTLVVSQLHRAANANDKTVFALAAESVEIDGATHPITASVDTFAIKAKSRGLMGAVLGAAVGAAAAKAAGGDTKQAIAAGAAGAAGGALIGRQMLAGDGCIERNATVRATLRSDLVLR